MIAITYALLATAMCSVWFSTSPIFPQRKLPLWQAFFIAAVLCALAAGVVDLVGLMSLSCLTLFAWLTTRANAARWHQVIFGFLTLVTALALATHRLPGFHNPVLLAGIQYSTNSAPFTLYINFDKGAVGLVLLALCCRKSSDWPELFRTFRQAAPIAGLTIVLVLSVALITHFANIDLKLPASTPIFIFVNLFFTVVAEEAFFRGFIQERLSPPPGAALWRNVFPVLISGLLFGLAHLAGGPLYATLATLAGLGYGAAYQRTRRIESAIAAHFLLNIAHFLILTYPYLH